MNILIIEDDSFFAENLKKAFQKNHIVHRVDIVHSFSQFMAIFSAIEGYDIILTDIRLSLDSSLNMFDGFHIIQTIRDAKIQVPIIIISGRDKLSEIQCAFGMGANDYIIKGIRMKELELRVIHWFRYYHMTRIPADTESIHTYKRLAYNLDKNEFLVENSPINLTKTNKYILSLFFINAEKILSESYLIGRVW